MLMLCTYIRSTRDSQTAPERHLRGPRRDPHFTDALEPAENIHFGISEGIYYVVANPPLRRCLKIAVNRKSRASHWRE